VIDTFVISAGAEPFHPLWCDIGFESEERVNRLPFDIESGNASGREHRNILLRGVAEIFQ
jgi:hypothetical protein